MAVIFSVSGDTKSFDRSSRIIAPLARWIVPDLSDEAVGAIVFFVRKSAHLTEYALLAWLLWRGLRKPVRQDPRPWNWRPAGFAVLFVALYAATDELHQQFVPNRHGSIWDVMLDTAGGVLGVLLIWGAFQARQWWRRRSAAKDGRLPAPQDAPCPAPGPEKR